MPRSHEFKIFSGSSHPDLAQKIATVLQNPLGKINLEPFSCGEQYVELMETVRDKVVFMIQTCREKDVDKDCQQLYFMSDAALNAYSGKRVAVIPHFGYARQDKIHKKREAISARVIAKCLEANGIDHVIACELHSPQIQGMFKIPVDHVETRGLFADYFKKKFAGEDPNNFAVVSTDAGGDKNARELAELLGIEDNVATILKKRPKHNQSKVTGVVGEVKDKKCILLDDMADTAGSADNARVALLKKGAHPDVYFYATHPVLSGKAIERLREAKFKEVVVADTMPIGPEKKFEGLVEISVAPLIAEKMAKIIGIPLPSNRKSDKSK